MFHTLPPTQTRPLPSRPQVASPHVRFGKTVNARDNNFALMESALKHTMPKYQYTIGEDLYSNYTDKLTFNRANKQINSLWKPDTGVTGGELQKFSETEKLGLVEESSDMFFEMFTMKAIAGGLITKEQVDKWTDELIPVAPEDPPADYKITEDSQVPIKGGKEYLSGAKLLDGTAFNEARDTIRREIKEAAEKNHKGRYERFRKMVNKDWCETSNDPEKPDRALDMLTLIGMKFALMSRKDSNYSSHLFGQNYQLLYGEGEELREEMKGDSKNGNPSKWLISGLSMLYTTPWWPGDLFRKPILSIVQRELGKDFKIDYKDLMETVYSKQIGRQELDFSRPDIDHRLKHDPSIRVSKDAMKKGNAKRKCVLKPYELWQESAVLKNAMRGDDKVKDIANKVLYTGV